MLSENSIKINLTYNGEDQNIRSMRCGSCRSLPACNAGAPCSFYSYAKERLNNISLRKGTIIIKADTKDELNKAITVLIRDFKLREHKTSLSR